ncbi:peptidase U34 dipeptidase [Dethiosulfovibrio peptidovorans DSM 11002]|uniref:Dipeptidase n=1 Tax=Dethiosulfovibrio peptidovorans DSM 11002 TaxID=469381 RepID=D2Z585_9BACT|nr:C69 family dipeptidase [Dethiosulfovibrio peptidovorans]EFC90644.1 peptidase U34 dipeptidase [Dethiosulfovibrio peptidovorans DSM 11002]
MRNKKLASFAVALCLVMAMALVASACTVVAVGKNATVNGTSIITHNDDSTSANFKLWIIEEKDWPEGSVRKLIMNDHGYEPGDVMGEMPQASHTYRYFKSRYSFMNEMGVAMGESTFGTDNEEIKKDLVKDSDGIIDCWLAQDIALERAATAREAVKIMGDLVEEFGWAGSGETINITDGDEVWIAEFYGRDLWCAVRMPDDMFFVAANRARLRDIDLTDKENVMHSPNIVSYGVNKGWIDGNVNWKSFSPAQVYAPYHDRLYSTRRVWRAQELVAPSLKQSPKEHNYPLFVKPDKKLSTWDIFKIKGDYYEGTDYDLTEGPAAGPWGNPIRIANKGEGAWERSINMHRTCYVHIGEVDPKLPAPIKGISWFGYGAPDTTYLTPLWPIMRKLPKFYEVGSRYEDFRRDSGWWVNTYVQEMTTLRYCEAIKEIYALRDPKMREQFTETYAVQKDAAKLWRQGKKNQAIDQLTRFAYDRAVDWNRTWLKLGDHLLGNYALGYRNFKITGYPQWWNDFIGYGPLER